MRGNPHEWRVTVDGCIVSTSHKTNQDGYLRIRDDRVIGGGRKPLIMAHRLVWEKANGEIPEGSEIDHTCGTRGCVNLEHLRVLTRSEHLDHTNRTRYLSRKEEAKKYWEANRCSGAALSEMFAVSFSASCKWIREWKGVETIS